MRKQLTIWGEGLGFYFTKNEIELYGLRKGDVYDFDFLEQELKKRKKSKRSKK